MPSRIRNKIPTTAKASWPLVRLGGYSVKIGSGSTPRGGEAVYVKKGVPLIRSMNVHFDGLRPEGLAFITKAEAEKLKNVTVQEGDVLLNITGASIGRVTTAPGEFAGARVNQHVCIIRPTSALLPKFLAYFFATPVEQIRINDCQVGATRQALTKQMIEDWQVPLPPLKEQQQIVSEIEKQVTRLEVGVAALRRVQVNLEHYRGAVLKAACEGRLVPTEANLSRAEGRPFESSQQLLARVLSERRQNWQGRGKYKDPKSPSALSYEPEALPEGWAWASPEQLSSSESYSLGIGPFGSNLKVGDYTTEGVPLIFVRNIRPGRFVKAKEVYVTNTKAEELKAHQASGGDILIAKMGAPPGNACLYPEDAPVAVITADCIKFRPSPLLSERRFFVHAINSDVVKPQILDITKGVAQMKISLGRFKSIAIPLPPLAEQTRIVAEVERRLSVVEELEAVVSVNLQRAKRLRRGILAAGFRSERSAEQRRPKEQVRPAPIRQTGEPIRPMFSPMKKQLKLTPESLVETVKRNKGRTTPSDLCLASNVEEEVEGFFEVLRECRDRGLLIVPSGIGAIIKLNKS